MVIERVPSVEMVRFVNSGTEACLSVVRLMRAYTGREKVRGGGARACNKALCCAGQQCMWLACAGVAWLAGQCTCAACRPAAFLHTREKCTARP